MARRDACPSTQSVVLLDLASGGARMPRAGCAIYPSGDKVSRYPDDSIRGSGSCLWRSLTVKKLRTSCLPWFGVAVLLFVVGSVIGASAGTIVRIVSIFVLLGASIRAVGLSVRDDPVSSETIFDPTARMMGWIRKDITDGRRRERATKPPR